MANWVSEFAFDLRGNGYFITGYNGSGGEVVIPSVHNGKPVIGIDSGAFFDRPGITSVTISNTVKKIGTSAFNACYKLASVTIGDGVTDIGQYAFEKCSALTKLTIGKSVKTIGKSAFAFCAELTSVTVPDSVITLDEGAFIYCDKLAAVRLGKSVQTIGKNAFHRCKALKSIVIPASVNCIGVGAFMGYGVSLQSMTFEKPLVWLVAGSPTATKFWKGLGHALEDPKQAAREVQLVNGSYCLLRRDPIT